MSIYDFDKMGDNPLIQIAFQALGDYVTQNKSLPNNWNDEDAKKFVQLVTPQIQELTKDTAADKK